MSRKLFNSLVIARLWLLGHASRGLEGLFHRTRLRTWPEGQAWRVAIAGPHRADPESLRLALDAIAARHPGSNVVILANGEWDGAGQGLEAARFPGLKSVSFANAAASKKLAPDKSASEQSSPAESDSDKSEPGHSPLGKSAPPFDLALFLHPHPFTNAAISAELPGARRAFRRLRARRRWVRFRTLELYSGGLAARLTRLIVGPFARRATAALSRAQDARLRGIIYPQLVIARRKVVDEPCAHALQIAAFPAPFPKLFCPDCGMGLTPPRPTAAQAKLDRETYGPGYADHYLYVGARELARSAKERQAQVVTRLRELGFDPDDAPGGRATVLDYGCGAGRFAPLWTQMGWNYLGVDGSPANIEVAARRYGQEPTGVGGFLGGPAARFRVGARPRDAADAGPFGAIFVAHVLEHLPDPLATLAALRRMAAPGGWIYAEVPDAFAYTWDERCRGFANPEHLWDFTPATLRALLYEAGWEEVRMIPEPPEKSFGPAAREPKPARLAPPFISALARNGE